MSLAPPPLDVLPLTPDTPAPASDSSPPPPDPTSSFPPSDSTPPAPSLPSPPPPSDATPPAPSTPSPSPPPPSDSTPPAPSPPNDTPSSDSPPPVPSTPAPDPPSPPPSSPPPPPPAPAPDQTTPIVNPSAPPPQPSSPSPPPPSPSPPSSSPSPPPSSPSPSPPSPPPSTPSPPPDPPSPSTSPTSPSPPILSPSPTPVSPSPPQSTPPSLVPSPKVPDSPWHPPPSPESGVLTPPPGPPSSGISANVAVGIAIGGVAVLAVFGLMWFLFCRRRKKDPYGIEGYYMPNKDAFYGDSARSGQQSYPPSTSTINPSHPPLAAVPSRSNSAGLSSTSPQPFSSGGSGGLWSSSSGAANSLQPSSSGIIIGNATSSFGYEELVSATDGFSDANLLGQGGFGYVHKGILPNGKTIAVKSLKIGSGQGDREFQAEVETISRVHHKHLVTLVGYCVAAEHKLLVYEFVPNGTLEFHLHGKGRPVLDWPIRLRIAVGAAKGLAYLHEDCHPKIIHRDIKAANILIDFKYEAKVADFGLAKFTSDAVTHVSTRVMGTFGYMAPEYASSGKLTEKSDVFSFGVLLLELITGRRPVNYSPGSEMEDSLVDWARPLLAKAVQDGNFDALIDPRLEKNYNYEEMGCMITCATSCIRHSARRRPRMSQVVRALEGNLALSDLNDGVKPGFSSFFESSDIDNSQSKEDMQKFRRMVFESEDYSSSNFSGAQSQHGS